MCFYVLAVGMAGVCVCVWKNGRRLDSTSSVKPSFTPPPTHMFAHVFSHRLRRKKLAKGDEMATALPATTQTLSIPGLPPTAISSLLTLFNHTPLCRVCCLRGCAPKLKTRPLLFVKRHERKSGRPVNIHLHKANCI